MSERYVRERIIRKAEKFFSLIPARFSLGLSVTKIFGFFENKGRQKNFSKHGSELFNLPIATSSILLFGNYDRET